MTELSRQIINIARQMWVHRWLGLLVAWVAALVGAGAVLVMPEQLEARAKVFVDTQTVLKPLMTGLAFQPDIDQQVRMLARTLISRPNVEALLANPKIGLEVAASPADREAQIESLMKAVKIEQTAGNNFYSLSYKDKDGARAQRLVEAIVSLFVDTGADAKRKDSGDASRFIAEQIKSYEEKLAEAEGRLKEFKLKNVSVVAATNQDYFARISGFSDEINRVRGQLNAAEQSRDTLKRELAAEQPQLPVDVAASGPSSLTPDLDIRIEALRRQNDDLLRRYTDEHPDVLATRRTIAQLEAQRRSDAETAARARAPSANVRLAPTNPVFQRLRLSLADAEANVASLRSQLGTAQARLDETKAQAGKIPQAEAELAQLNRDYDVIRKNYEQLVSRREAASLGVKIDQTSPMAEFRIIEPPRVHPTPAFPNKMHGAIAVTLLSLLLGGCVAYAMAQLRPTVSSERELRELTKRPVLGGISEFVDPYRMAVLRKDKIKMLRVAGLLIGFHIIWLALMSARAA